MPGDRPYFSLHSYSSIEYMSYYLWLDDTRQLPKPSTKEWVAAKSMHEFKHHIQTRGLPKYISFDHDLTEAHYVENYMDNRTGLDCIVWLINYVESNKLEPPQWGIHTMNVKRIPVMLALLHSIWPAKAKSWPQVM